MNNIFKQNQALLQLIKELERIGVYFEIKESVLDYKARLQVSKSLASPTNP